MPLNHDIGCVHGCSLLLLMDPRPSRYLPSAHTNTDSFIRNATTNACAHACAHACTHAIADRRGMLAFTTL